MKTSLASASDQQKADAEIRYVTSCSNSQTPECVTLPWGAPPDDNTTSDEIIATIVSIARESLQSIVYNLAPDEVQFVAKLTEAQAYLQEPLDSHRIAIAYVLVHSATKSFGSGSDNEIKQAALIIRESLVLHTTREKTNVTSDDIEEAMTTVFKRNLDSEFMSQFALAFSTIIRLGKSYEEFEKAAPKIIGRSLGKGDMEIIHRVYADRYRASPEYTSRAKASGKQRGRTE